MVYIKKRMDAYQRYVLDNMEQFNSVQPEIVSLIDSVSNFEQNWRLHLKNII